MQRSQNQQMGPQKPIKTITQILRFHSLEQAYNEGPKNPSTGPLSIRPNMLKRSHGGPTQKL